jgi:hypothetical protein
MASPAGLGALGVLPTDLLSREVLPRIAQHDLARVAVTSRALMKLTRPLLSRALRCSYCMAHLCHPRELDPQRAGHPTLFVLQSSVRLPTLLSANTRYYCASCKCRIGKPVVFNGGAAEVQALEIGPVRLVDIARRVVGLLDGLSMEPLAMLCRGPACRNGVLGDAREDLLYRRTERDGLQYFVCYALYPGTTCLAERTQKLDHTWGDVQVANIACASCGIDVGYKLCGRVGLEAENATLDDRGDVRFTMLRCDAVQQTPGLNAFFP